MYTGKWTVQKLTFGKDPYWKHIESQVFPIVGTITDVLESAAFENYFCCSCRVRCCHFLQFNCNVAPKLRFHAYVISVFKDELIFLFKTSKKVRF